MEEILNSFAQKYYYKSASLDHESPEEGGRTAPQTHSLAIIISHDRAGIEDISDLLHKLAVGPLITTTQQFQHFVSTDLNYEILLLERILLKTHKLLSLTFYCFLNHFKI